MLNLKNFGRRSPAPHAEWRETRIIIERLEAQDVDSCVYLEAIWPYFLGERPRTRIVRGETTALYVEGPRFTTGPLSLPLGAQLETEVGWINLGPLDAQELSDRHEKAIDAVNFRFVCERGYLTKALPCRTRREQPLDDMLAFREMETAAKLRTAPAPRDTQEGACHDERD